MTVFRIEDPKDYAKAGLKDLMQTLPVPGNHSMYFPKATLEILVSGIVNREPIHLSGPTGAGKTSLVEALHKVPENFNAVCRGLGYPEMKLKVSVIETVSFESSSEIYFRRSLDNGCTYDEKATPIKTVEKAAKNRNKKVIHLGWVREIGRAMSSMIQSGFLNIMTKGDVVLPDGTRIPGGSVAWIMDSNYQAENDVNYTHTLCTMDSALKRRPIINLTIEPLNFEQEVKVLRHLFPDIDENTILKAAHLGQVTKRYQAEGELLSAPPPTIYNLAGFLRMASFLPHFSLQEIAQATILGNTSAEDRTRVVSVFNEVFGLQDLDEEGPMSFGNLF